MIDGTRVERKTISFFLLSAW